MLASLFLVKLFAIIVLADDRNKSITPMTRRVLYGDIARIEDYPYCAGLWNCGAAIISDVWVVTAAHCVFNAEVQGPKLVYVGGNTTEDSVKVAYNEFIVHPKFINDVARPMNDIALLKLTAPLKFSATVQPAKLPTSVPRNAVIVSRGSDENGQPTTNLRKVDLIVVPLDECTNMRSEFLEDTILCTKRQGHIVPSVCRGDSGSPVLGGNTLVGVHSYGPKYCEQGKEGYHTNVLSFVPWIRANTGI